METDNCRAWTSDGELDGSDASRHGEARGPLHSPRGEMARGPAGVVQAPVA